MHGRTSQIVNAFSLILLSLLSVSCAASMGAAYHRTADRSKEGNGVAGRLEGLTLLSRDKGVALGWDGEVGWRLGSPALAPDLGRIHGLVGWSSSPLPYRRCPLGVDLLAALGLGHYAYDNRVVHALSVGPRIALPIRLVRGRQLWDSEEKIGMTPLLVPWVEWSWYRPIDKGEERSLHSEGSVGIALRYHLWSALIP